MDPFKNYYFKELLSKLSEVVKSHADVANWERQETAIKSGKALLEEIDSATREE